MLRYNRLAIILGVLALAAGCAKSEAELRAEAEKKANSEINFRNFVGLIEYCAGKGYLDRKLAPKLKADFDDDFDAAILKTANQAYGLGRKGTLLLRMNQKSGADNQTADEGGGGQQSSAPDNPKIDVTFTRNEERNGELSVFCKRAELWGAREAAAAAKAAREEKKPEAAAHSGSPSSPNQPEENAFSGGILLRGDR